MSLLRVEALEAFYDQLPALRGVSFAVGAGEALAVVGANGAGKTTLLHGICGLHRVARGQVIFDDEPIHDLPAHRIVRRGIALVPEGRRIFPSLTVDENLRVAEDRVATGRARAWTRDRIYTIFPQLRPAANRRGTQISGGQQQMLALGRALLSAPRLLLLDEVSLGLAPAVVQTVYAALALVRQEGTTLIFVEQDVRRGMAFSDHFICLQKGAVRLAGRSDTPTLADMQHAYFG